MTHSADTVRDLALSFPPPYEVPPAAEQIRGVTVARPGVRPERGRPLVASSTTAPPPRRSTARGAGMETGSSRIGPGEDISAG
jgi:hypothetical protein